MQVINFFIHYNKNFLTVFNKRKNFKYLFLLYRKSRREKRKKSVYV